MQRHGWLQIAFERELADGLTPVHVGEARMMVVKQNGRVRVFEATCPHRGANLAYGGKLCGDHVICPFHSERVHLGKSAGFFVRDYDCLTTGGLVFVRMSDAGATDLPAAMKEVQSRYTLFPGFSIEIEAPLEIIADNAFDAGHFKSVHGLLNEPEFRIRTGDYGELRADGEFVFPSRGPSRSVRAKYATAAFGPAVIVSELAGDPPYNYVVITSIAPLPQPNRCVLRVSLGLKPPIDEAFKDRFMGQSRQGLESDHAVWKHIDWDHVPAWRPRDTASMAFMDFCKGFRG
jgi:phenylpropionate dioxygenase-like ring-hydroxylating dioxygenase large terminal subunit